MTELMIAFSRTHDAIRAEQLLLDLGLVPQVMPLPGQVQAGCGLCLRVGLEHEQPARNALSGIDAAYYLRQTTPTRTTYDRLP